MTSPSRTRTVEPSSRFTTRQPSSSRLIADPFDVHVLFSDRHPTTKEEAGTPLFEQWNFPVSKKVKVPPFEALEQTSRKAHCGR